MNAQNITFSANEQVLTKTDDLLDFASNTVSYIEATFTLGTNWTGFDSVRAVWKSDYHQIATVLDANHKCVVPPEILMYRSKVYVNLVGSIAENNVLTDRLTTFPVQALVITQNAEVDGTETVPVTPSQFEQFVDAVQDAADSISDYSYDSEAWAVGKRGGVDVPSTDETYHNNSKYWAEQNAGLSDEVADLADDVADLKEDFAPRLKAMDGEYFIADSMFMLGNMNITSSGWSYNSWATRVVIKDGVTFHLKEGDTISLSDYTSARYYLGWQSTDTAYHADGWRQADFHVTHEGDYVIIMSTVPEVTPTSVSPLVSLLTIKSDSSLKIDVATLDTELGKSNKGFENFNSSDFAVGRFENGYISPSQSAYWTTTRRVTTPTPLTTDRDIAITVNNGFRFCVVLVRGTSFIDSGWQDTSFKVRSGESFYISIQRYPEAQTDSTVADSGGVPYFLNQIQFETVLGAKVTGLMPAMDALSMTPRAYDWEQGGLDAYGETTDDKRIRMETQEIMPDYVVIESKTGYKALIYTYSADGNVVSAGTWKTGSFTTAKGTATYFRVVLAKSSDATIATTDATNITITYLFDDVPIEVMELANKVNRNFGTTYFGLPVSAKQGYNVERILGISYGSGGTLNSIAVYEDYIVAIINGLNLIRIYNKTAKTLAYEIEIDLGHANNVGIGSKYDESDLLPLLYVEKEDSDGTYNVVRIISNATASIIKTYTFPRETFGRFPQVTWNFKDGVCYSLGYNADAVLDSNKTIFVRANLNDETLNEDGSYTPNVLFSCDAQKMLYMQDSKYYNGMIYLAESSTTTDSAVSYVNMIDTSSGNIITRIPAPFTGEIEGMAIYEEDGTVKICSTTYFSFFEMTFA